MSDVLPDTIRKEILLKAPLERVWNAIANASEFGAWFGMRFDQPEFRPHSLMTGFIKPTEVNDDVAAAQKPYEGTAFEFRVNDIVPMKSISFSWHPYAVDKTHDYSDEPMTLITFTLEEAAGGTRLVLTESGFDRIPLERRAEAFRMNEGGWAMQMRLIEAYLAR